MRGHNISFRNKKISLNYPQYPLLSGVLSKPTSRMANSEDPALTAHRYRLRLCANISACEYSEPSL